MEGENLNPDEVREKLSSLGDSLLVVGDDETIRAHIHTFEPGTIVSYATS